ncbi:B-box zinc finger protein [Abditibacterium utsteinense]|nr:B-box zinc finger protein [Abditibacterium utsteinense]
MAFEELKVPGEENVWFCARHKNVQTRLRCGRCEKPICPKCTVMAPTGARCRECVSNRDAHIYQVAPRHLALAFGASTLVGALGIFLTSIAGAFWLWVLLYAPAIGPLLGRLITKITGGKRGPKVAFVVSCGLVCGALLSALGSEFFRAAESETPFVFLVLANFPLWVFLVIAIGGVWWWLK